MKNLGFVVLAGLALAACDNQISDGTSGGTGGDSVSVTIGSGSGGTTGSSTAGTTTGGGQQEDAGPPAVDCKGGEVCAASSSYDHNHQVSTPYPSKNTCSDSFLGLGSVVSNVTLGVGCADLTGASDKYCRLSDIDMTFLHCSGYKYALIDISAVWCDPCNAEAQELPSHTDAWRKAGGIVFSALVEGAVKSSPPSTPTQAELVAWWSKYGTNYPMAIDPTQIMELAAAVGTQVYLPTNAIVDLSTMKVVYNSTGFSAGGGDPTFAQMDSLLGTH
jgi:hypothetical protein